MYSDLLCAGRAVSQRLRESLARAYGRNISSISVSFTECQKEDMVVNLLASGLGAALARLLMLRVLYRTLRGALRKVACRADGLEGMTTISIYISLTQLVRVTVS